jgi:hypothetical protein
MVEKQHHPVLQFVDHPFGRVKVVQQGLQETQRRTAAGVGA